MPADYLEMWESSALIVCRQQCKKQLEFLCAFPVTGERRRVNLTESQTVESYITWKIISPIWKGNLDLQTLKAYNDKILNFNKEREQGQNLLCPTDSAVILQR